MSVPVFLGAAALGITLTGVVWQLARWSMLRTSATLPLVERALDPFGLAVLRVDLSSGRVGASKSLKLWMEIPQLRSLSDFMAAIDVASVDLFTEELENLRQGKPLVGITLKTHGMRYVEFIPAFHCDLGKRHVWLVRDVSANQRHLALQAAEYASQKVEVEQLSALLNACETPKWIRDKEQKIIWNNRAFAKAVEHKQDNNVLIKELYPQAPKLARQARALKVQQEERLPVVVAGKRCFYQVIEVFVPKLDMNVGYALDISELEEARKEVERHLSAQADLLESSTSAVAIFGADTRLQFYNQSFVHLWGLDEDWLDSKPSFGELLELLREKRKLPEQANFRAFKQQQVGLFTKLIDTQEEFYYLPDGRTLRVIAIPHAWGGLLFSYEDVTDRLALERSYNTLIAVQRETLDNLHEGVVVFGEDGRMRLSNPVYATIWNLTLDDVASRAHFSEILEKTKDFYNFNNAEEWNLFCANFMGQMQSRQLHASRLERLDGSVLDWNAVPLPDGGTLFTYTDVTANTLVERSLREKNEALEAADSLKTEFLANVSYELRSPLTSISGFSEMLRQDYFGPLTEKQREYVDGIMDSSHQLMRLINDILDLASMEAGYLTLELKTVNVHSLFESVLVLFRERMKEAGQKAIIECPADIGSFHADEVRMRQVLFHLLSTAIKYSNDGANIIIGAENKNRQMHIFVADEGVGIAAEEQNMVFKKFHHGQGKRAGTGLGLSMVKSLVELHGGQVELVSELGKGTRITCVIPVE